MPGSRLKFYHDADFDETAEICEHLSLQDIIFEARDMVSHRRLVVAWRGLQSIENSWEPTHSNKRAVPALVTKYAKAHSVGELL